MRKLLLSAIVSLVAVVGFPVAASAVSSPAITNVTGTILNNGSPVTGADVTVTCNGNVQTDTSDTDGSYLVQYAAADCPNGATATASASKDGAAGSNTAKVNKVTTKLNVGLADVNIALPEMGLVTGGVATVAAGGALMIIRRRQVGQN